MHTTYILSYYTCHVYHNEFKVATFPSQHHKMENMEGAPTQIFRPHHPTTKTQRSHILYMYHNERKSRPYRCQYHHWWFTHYHVQKVVNFKRGIVWSLEKGRLSDLSRCCRDVHVKCTWHTVESRGSLVTFNKKLQIRVVETNKKQLF